MEENLISWNLPNIITLTFMVVIIWMIFAAVGHTFRQTTLASSSGSVDGSQPFGGTSLGQVGG